MVQPLGPGLGDIEPGDAVGEGQPGILNLRVRKPVKIDRDYTPRRRARLQVGPGQPALAAVQSHPQAHRTLAGEFEVVCPAENRLAPPGAQRKRPARKVSADDRNLSVAPPVDKCQPFPVARNRHAMGENAARNDAFGQDWRCPFLAGRQSWQHDLVQPAVRRLVRPPAHLQAIRGRQDQGVAVGQQRHILDAHDRPPGIGVGHRDAPAILQSEPRRNAVDRTEQPEYRQRYHHQHYQKGLKAPLHRASSAGASRSHPHFAIHGSIVAETFSGVAASRGKAFMR